MEVEFGTWAVCWQVERGVGSGKYKREWDVVECPFGGNAGHWSDAASIFLG